MRKNVIVLLVLFFSIRCFSQEEFRYKNQEFDVEILFPSKFSVRDSKPAAGITQSTASCNILTAGLSYNILIQKSTVKLDMAAALSKSGDVVIKRKYSTDGKEVTEFTCAMAGACMIYKSINYKNILYMISVYSESCPKDKDVFPFFNSLKIDGVMFQDPSTDNSKYNKYSIDNLSGFKGDTVKQIVYVNSKPDTVKQIVYVNSNTNAVEVYRFEKAADVDKKIPQSSVVNSNRFALIIGNEDYSSHQIDLKAESNVEFARNDASAFKEYCMNTMGVPEKNITFLLDATLGQINQGISKLNLLSKALNGKAQLILYYAGHGLPDEVTKEPYLIPVDVNGTNVTSGIKLQDLYNKLTEFPSERVTVFMDACFTGGGRNSGLLAARSVKIRPKEETMKGNLVVFSSSSGEQSSLPYSENKHGMFTYFLLKKFQETEGILTYSELSAFLKEKIAVESLIVNNKEQNPQVNISSVIENSWGGWKVK